MRPPHYPVVLASQSPRRAELLSRLIPSFIAVPADLDEESLTVDDPWQTAQRLAREKALAVFDAHPDSLVIAGDTVVAIEVGGNWVQLGKPVDDADAERMLKMLSSSEHVVITGLALRWPKGLIARTETTKVQFKALSTEDIRAYLESGEHLDKAGGYGIQGLARDFVLKLEGELENVVGLPMNALVEALKEVH